MTSLSLPHTSGTPKGTASARFPADCLSRVRFSAEQQAAIAMAARHSGVPAGLIAGVLADERARWDTFDRLQDSAVRLLLGAPRPLAGVLMKLLGHLTGRELSRHSIGPAQMKPVTLREIEAAGLLPQAMRQNGNLLNELRLLQDEAAASLLVALRLRQTARHWAAYGIDLRPRPEVLGTLYSLGLTGRRGLHSQPQANARGEAIARYAAAFGRGVAHQWTTPPRSTPPRLPLSA